MSGTWGNVKFWKGKSILCNIGVSKWRIFWKPSSNKNTNFFLFLISYFFLFTANKNTIWLVPCVCPLNHPAGHLFHLDFSSSCFLFLFIYCKYYILKYYFLFYYWKSNQNWLVPCVWPLNHPAAPLFSVLLLLHCVRTRSHRLLL